MNRGSLVYQSLFVVSVAFASSANANPIIHTTAFDENIVIETDTFETPSGVVLFTSNGVGYTDWLSTHIASDLAGGGVPPPFGFGGILSNRSR